ncbi:MAG: SRPBCC family protein [Dehalococcoidia bacterium]
MAAYYTSQEYDAPSSFIWTVLTDFGSWPEWFPNLSELRFNADDPRDGMELVGIGERPDEWTRWQISRFAAPSLLRCEHVDSNVPLSRGVAAAYLLFELADDEEGCRLDLEIGAQGQGIIGDLVVGTGLNFGARRLLPEIIDAFNGHVVRRASAGT